jgi:DNA-binding response OmpR family regulator
MSQHAAIIAGLSAASRQGNVPSILIVEDEPLVRLALSDFLQDRGFKVFEARNGEEAMAFLSLENSTVSLVFSDINLGAGPSGLDLAVWLRRHQPDLRIALTSGSAVAIKEARLSGCASALLSKPYNFESVALALRGLIFADNDP